MRKLFALLLLPLAGVYAQTHPLQRLIEAARADSPELKELLGHDLPLLKGRDGAAVWGQEFLFAVESDTAASSSRNGNRQA